MDVVTVSFFRARSHVSAMPAKSKKKGAKGKA